MVTRDMTSKKVLLRILKDFSSIHTITALAKELGLSRVGIWKMVKKLEAERYITLKTVGSGKTNTSMLALNWDNPLVEKILSLSLTEEALKQRRWQANFIGLGSVTDFVILYGSIVHSPQQAHDIDIVSVASKKNFIKIQKTIDEVQKILSKKIHAINFTESEFKAELKRQNKAFIDAVKKGVILFGQENFVRFMKEITR